jgi:hypothetical protein
MTSEATSLDPLDRVAQAPSASVQRAFGPGVFPLTLSINGREATVLVDLRSGRVQRVHGVAGRRGRVELHDACAGRARAQGDDH